MSLEKYYKTVFVGKVNAIVCALEKDYLIVPKDKINDYEYLEEAWGNNGIRVNISKLIEQVCSQGFMNIDNIKA